MVMLLPQGERKLTRSFGMKQRNLDVGAIFADCGSLLFLLW